MQPKTPKLLEDIRDSATFIREVVAGKSIDDYRADRLLRQAIERNFEICCPLAPERLWQLPGDANFGARLRHPAITSPTASSPAAP